MKKLLLFAVIVYSILMVSTNTVKSQEDVYLDNLNVYVTTYGRIALYSLPDTIREVYKTAILVGTGETTVFDLENDYEVQEDVHLLPNPKFADYEIYGSFNNTYSANPPDFLEKQTVYCWQNQNSIIVKYTLISNETNSTNAIVGLELVPEVMGEYSGNDTVRYSSQSKILSVTKSEAVGYKSLNADFKSVGTFLYFDGYTTDSLFYNWLTYNGTDTLFITDPNDPDVNSPIMIPAYNSQTFVKGDSVTYYVAIAYGKTKTEMLASLAQAEEKYNMITSVESDLQNIPSQFTLDQNYPNPFNPSTKISFGLPQKSKVVLKIFNVLGQQVAELLNQQLEAGNHVFNFDGTNLTSGVYVYSLETENGSLTKKMMLLK